MSFIFGGDTGRSYEEIKRDQAVAQAMLEQSMAPAKTIGGGLAALGNAWGGRMLADKSDKRMSEGRKRASEMFEKVLRSNRATTPSETSAPVAPSSDVQTMPLAAPLPGQDVIEAIIQQESAGNPSAISPKGAGGLMQIMPATARDPGYGVPNIYDMSAQMGGSAPPPPEAGDDAMTQWLADPANAEINKAFGTQYFNAMESQYGGDREKALAAYNAGPGAVDQYGGVPPFDETQAYVKAITGDLGGTQSAPAGAPAAPPASGPMESPAAISPELLSLLSDPYLDDGQRSVVQALLQQQISANAPPETMSPYQQAQIDLQNRRLQAQLDGRLNTGTNVNVNTGSNGIDYGKPPADMAWARNPDQSVKLDERGIPIALPIDGTKLDQAGDKIEKAEIAKAEGQKKTAIIQIEEINRAKAKISENPTWTTGFLGGILKEWGGTEAKDVSALLETVQANIGFDRLNQMRAESPTGGALGNVTERELKFLQSVAGSLDQAQSAEQLLENLSRLEAEIGKVVHGPDWTPESGEAESDDVSDLLEKYGE